MKEIQLFRFEDIPLLVFTAWWDACGSAIAKSISIWYGRSQWERDSGVLRTSVPVAVLRYGSFQVRISLITESLIRTITNMGLTRLKLFIYGKE